ncbi:hypothetical protein FRC12_014325 [Ceratobasidium sp. 428]|nr:hypothetical protein FRC09_011199 [Ceratobasidium sp. 395]KAG8746294.1 hypothetical protein FRC12_014325 [Ceratobasidium sp. 428]
MPSLATGPSMAVLNAYPSLSSALYKLTSKKDKIPLELHQALEQAAAATYAHERALMDPRTRTQPGRDDAKWALSGYQMAILPLVKVINNPPRYQFEPWVELYRALSFSLKYMYDNIKLQPMDFIYAPKDSPTVNAYLTEMGKLVDMKLP